MTGRLAIASLLALFLTGIAAAEKPAPIELGFKQDKVYSFGSLDNVNLFNGNMIFTIPLGMQYPVSSNFSYGLTLVYNSKAWDYFYVEAFSDPKDRRAWSKPNVRSNAGMGWRVSLGRLIPPAAFTSTRGYSEVDSDFWTYEGPGGEEHSLAVRGSTATVSLSTDAGREALDDASLRMVVISSTSRQIQFPNGDVHTFTYERNSWRLTKMVDAFNNYVNVAYTYDGTTDRTTAWTLTDIHGRVHTVSFVNSAYMAETIDRGQIVSSITTRGIGATTTNVTYTFNYNSAASVQYGCEHTVPMNSTDFSPSPTTVRATVPLLTSVSLPDGSNWTFDYYYDSVVAGDCAAGLLKDVTLPTRGKMSYTYQTYTIPANDWCGSDGPSNSSAGVKTRTVDGQTWSYVQTIGPIAQTYMNASYLHACGEPTYEGEQLPYYPKPARRWKRTTVIAPHDGVTHTRTDHYFSLWRTKNFEDDPLLGADEKPVFEYGQPATAGWPGVASAKAAPNTGQTTDVSAADVPGDAAARYLFEQTWTGCTASGDCSTATGPLQSKYSRRAQFGSYYKTASERTVYEDDSSCAGVKCYVQADSSDHNGAGLLRQVVRSSNFRGDTQSTERTEYATWTSTDVNNSALKWITGKYTEKKKTIGTRTSRTLYHIGTSGELLRTRTLVNAAAESANDILESYTYGTTGNVSSIRTYGGDAAAQALPTGVALSTIDLSTRTPQYRNDYTWSYGGLGAEWPVNPSTGLAMLFKTRDYTRHSGTGLVTESKGTEGLITSYGYTAWGSLASVTPPGELQTTYTYAPATTTARAKVTMTRGDTTVVYEYDAMGRLAREQKTIPGSGCVHRKMTYDALSRLKNETSWHGCSVTSPGQTDYAYDSFGRTTSVKAPDGKTGTNTYTGSRLIKRVSNVAGVSGESAVAKSEEYDGFGRLIEVKENADGVAQTTSYAYDEEDRLISVTMGTQTRLFTYDGRGFLTSEQHPELANGTTRYREFDARGHAGRRTTGADNGVFDIRFTFDPAERVTLVTRVSDGRKLKEFIYDDPDAVYCGGQICRGKLAAAARYHWDSDLSNVAGAEALAVTESYKYDATNGRPTRRDRAVGNTSLFTGNSFYTMQSYNNIGAVATVSYPCSDIAGCAGGVQRVVTNNYTNSVLTSVTNYASSITYSPSGILNTVVHGATGAAGSEIWTRDPYGMARPLSIAAKSASNVTHWSSGDYAYDGSGNIKSIGVAAYAYDPLQRLVRWTQNGADGSSTWNGREYDRYGNPLYNTSGYCGAGGVGCTSTNGASRSLSGTTNRYVDTTYDAAGNVTADTAGRSFTYDGLGMATRLQIGTRQFRYLYTVDDERIAAIERVVVSGVVKNKTTYTVRGFHNQLLGVWQTDPNTNTASWVEDEIYRGTSLLARESATRGTTHYFLDHLGSPRAITSATGTLLGTQTFNPWGSGGTADGGALQFTGHERDAALYGTGNTTFPDYMHARYYDVAGGRFMAMDPAWESADGVNPQSWNRYAYVENNPMNVTDPDGRMPHWVAGALLGGAIGGGAELVMQLAHGEQVNFQKVGASAVGGAVTGVAAAATGGLSLLSMAGGSVAGGMTERAIDGDASSRVLSPANVVLDVGAGIVGGKAAVKAGEKAAKAVTNSVSHTVALRQADSRVRAVANRSSSRQAGAKARQAQVKAQPEAAKRTATITADSRNELAKKQVERVLIPAIEK